jgi:hypothetical protein
MKLIRTKFKLLNHPQHIEIRREFLLRIDSLSFVMVVPLNFKFLYAYSQSKYFIKEIMSDHADRVVSTITAQYTTRSIDP